MPTPFRNWPSVAPDCRIGSTGTPGHISVISLFTGSMMAGVSAGGAEFGPRISSVSTLTAGSAMALTSAACADASHHGSGEQADDGDVARRAGTAYPAVGRYRRPIPEWRGHSDLWHQRHLPW